MRKQIENETCHAPHIEAFFRKLNVKYLCLKDSCAGKDKRMGTNKNIHARCKKKAAQHNRRAALKHIYLKV